MKKLFLAAIGLLFYLVCFTQIDPNALINWQSHDPKSGAPGTGIDQVYSGVLKNKTPYQTIVAVIDGGVDVNHEDLKQNIWVNPKEIPGNGIDDDRNGYIDDIYGWNFIGNKSGLNVYHDTYEGTRTVATLQAKYANVKPNLLTKENKAEYDQYISKKKALDERRLGLENQWAELMRTESILLQIMHAVQKEMGGAPLNLKNLEKVDTNKNEFVNIGTKILKQIIAEQPSLNSFDHLYQSIKTEYAAPRQELEAKFLYQLDPTYDSRNAIVGDQYENYKENQYGNNDVTGPDAFHGTHVSGIIAAVRGNGQGMDGIANNSVKIMSLRVVPDGDERDKDIANAIRYAVDNGARVINMSFGKGESPYKKAVDDAVLYAEKHDVLLVHAAGNENSNNDQEDHFPKKNLDRKCLFCSKEVKNWLDVGALSFTEDADMVASFSNYGKKSVDIFSPGVRIYSTVPNNRYEFADGTSMASPVMAGVAAVIRSYFPTLSAKQVIQAILENGNTSTKKVKKPGTDQEVLLSDLCATGSYVNAAKAILAAAKMKGTVKYNAIVAKPKA